MKILVTGGAGYVGSSCLRHIARQGHEVLAYDNLVEGHPAAVGDHQLVIGRHRRHRRRWPQTLREFGADAVMHFAAATYVGESVENPEYHYRNNIGGTLSLLNAMRAAGVKRMLFSSTCATYGMPPKVPMSEDTPQDPYQPVRAHEAGGRVDDPRFFARLRARLHALALLQRVGRRPTAASSASTTTPRPT